MLHIRKLYLYVEDFIFHPFSLYLVSKLRCIEYIKDFNGYMKSFDVLNLFYFLFYIFFCHDLFSWEESNLGFV